MVEQTTSEFPTFTSRVLIRKWCKKWSPKRSPSGRQSEWEFSANLHWVQFADFLAFRDVLQEIEFSGFAIVEQDMYPAPFDKLAEHGYEGIELRPKALSTS